MVWGGLPGSGDLLLKGTDTFYAGTITGDVFTQSKDESGSSEGVGISSIRVNGSPASGDTLTAVRLKGQDDNGTTTTVAKMSSSFTTDPNSGAVSGRGHLTAVTSGTLTPVMYFAQGVFSPNATGGDQGADTANFSAVYDDGVALTCYVLEEARTGKIDMSIFERAGSLKPATAFETRAKDTLDPSAFSTMWKQSGHLPGLPSREEWLQSNAAGKKYSLGDMVQRLIELAEVQAVHIAKLNERIERLEAQKTVSAETKH